MSVNNCLLADILMVLSTPLPISVFQNEVSLHSSQLLPVPLFGKRRCRGTDVTQEAVTLLESMEVWTPGMGWDGPEQLSSASSLLPIKHRFASQMQQSCSGKLRPEKMQLLRTERGSENYSGSPAPKSMGFMFIKRFNACEILPQTSGTKT